MGIKTTGLQELQDELKRMSDKVEELEEGVNVPLDELLTPTFMSSYTDLQSADELLNKSPFTIDTPEDFAAVPDAEWDDYISSVSVFQDWDSMLGKAMEEWTVKQLGL